MKLLRPHTSTRVALSSLVVLAGLVTLDASSRAESITLTAGHDFYQTIAASLDFSVDPIPADFFAPGSDPFTGIVPLRSEPLGSHQACPGEDLNSVDTIMRRLDDAVLDADGDEVTVPVELVALQLAGVDPITVTFGGGKRAMNYFVKIHKATTPPSEGSLLLRRLSMFTGTASHEYVVWITVGFFETEPLGDETPPFRTRSFFLTDRSSPDSYDGPREPTPSPGGIGKSTACRSNLCILPDGPGDWAGPGLTRTVIGVCQEAPVAVEAVSWGGLKGRF